MLRALIDRKGWADRTTFIISSDHGEGFFEAQMGLLAAFFDVHTLQRPGYTPPYRRW